MKDKGSHVGSERVHALTNERNDERSSKLVNRLRQPRIPHTLKSQQTSGIKSININLNRFTLPD